MSSQINATRRAFFKYVAAFCSMLAAGTRTSNAQSRDYVSVMGEAAGSATALNRNWESLNPGYWRTTTQSTLRRVLRAYGDRARRAGFPFHYRSRDNPDGKIEVDYDPSLPYGTIWHRRWRLSGHYRIRVVASVRGLTQKISDADDDAWAMYRNGYALFGVAFGGQTQFESFRPSPGASPTAVVFENGQCGFFRFSGQEPALLAEDAVNRIPAPNVGDRVELAVDVQQRSATLRVAVNDGPVTSVVWAPAEALPGGYFGLVSRGLLDVEVERVELWPGENVRLDAPVTDCHVCYALGDTLRRHGGHWEVTFVALFRSPGERSDIRISDSEIPPDGWENVRPAGSASIESNAFRINTALIRARLPRDPAEATHYFTVWKDGRNVTADIRLGTSSVGPGTGLVGDVPAHGNYAGRLPKLTAPYRLCGLSCHAIHTASKADLPGSSGGIHRPFFVHDQPCRGAFEHFDQYGFQILLWEDDIWYLELLLYPPSTEDAYKVITSTIAGPTTRWKMMRHWNVLNPGDHDYGMDDVKGPEQYALRNLQPLGQDREYMVRNFQIVSHLTQGMEDPDGTDNPRRWRKWKMPQRDFAILITDSRLWRTSQDTAIWDDNGWGHLRDVYSRTDPTRTLLGEEQFAWLTTELRSESAPVVCVSGLGPLHTIWGGNDGTQWLAGLTEWDRVSADYSGWVKVATDRVIDLLASRSGVVSLYGDVHAGCILKNREQGLIECAFGPIGRWGGRSLVNGFGRRMSDFDGRPLDVYSLYHHQFEDIDLTRQDSINYWNFLEAVFDPDTDESQIRLKIRNIRDRPDAPARGGGSFETRIADTGRPIRSRLPPVSTIPNADVVVLDMDARPIRGTRSDRSGVVQVDGLTGVAPGATVTIVAVNDADTESQTVRTLEPM